MSDAIGSVDPVTWLVAVLTVAYFATRTIRGATENTAAIEKIVGRAKRP